MNQGQTEAGAGLVGEALEEFRRLGLRVGEAQGARLRGRSRRAPGCERRLGLFSEAEGHARGALQLALELGDRMSSVFAAAELASAAAARGETALAGRVWGAIESEEAIAPIGQWPSAGGPDFDRARQEGALLSLAEAKG